MGASLDTLSSPSRHPASQQPASLLPTLPGSDYTSPEVFDRDQAAVFARSWICIGRADQVVTRGAFLRADVAGQDVFVVRGRDGRLRGFKNLCRHRGAVLCTDDGGTFGNAIRCTYHAWTYSLDGQLVTAPNMTDMPDLVKADHGLLGVRAEEWLGYVWVTIDAAAADLDQQMRPQLEARLGDPGTLDRYGISDLIVGHTITYDVASNWKSIAENFMECYHCATIHPELTAALPQFASGYGTVSGGVGAGAVLADDRAAFTLSGRAAHRRLPGLLDSDDRLFYGIVLRPNAFIILVSDHVLFFRADPMAAGHTRVVVDWLFHLDEVRRPGFDPADSVRIMDITNRQDFAACERCHAGMRSPDYRGVLVPAEHVICDFYDWYRQMTGAAA
ncbi:MAG: aromatic ring-hydroxylating dioxygenase subunit alpha [Actinomycetota bacterium]|nr:aromatic ring-hydroxylating dioxygenase subunit alpha [Actinomycetota bacterium]